MNKKITFPLLFSIICCLTQYHRQDHLETFFLCIGMEFEMGLKKTILRNMLLWLSLVFYLTIQQSFDNPIFWQSKFFCPKSDSFSSHFSPSRESFSRQTQRQKLLLFTQRAIVVELAINPLKNSEKKLKTWKFVLLSFQPRRSLPPPVPIWH